MKVAALAGAISLIGAISGGTVYAVDRFASKVEVADLSNELREQIAANSLATLYIQLENAIKSGDRQQILRLCWAIQQQTGQKPAGCP